jgi:hypothetical protein
MMFDPYFKLGYGDNFSRKVEGHGNHNNNRVKTSPTHIHPTCFRDFFVIIV